MTKEKQVIYRLSIATEKEILRAEKIQARLYNEYSNIAIYHDGLCRIKIIATN